jgi:hypothetical protein
MSQTRPDAVIIPSDIIPADTDNRRKESVVEIAENLLECGPLELAWCHPDTRYYFCTRDPHDTEKYATWHPKIGKPRYRWTDGLNGIKLGYLLSEDA